MIKNKINHIILAPCVSEKSSNLAGISQYVFKVGDLASKTEIIQALKILYNVDVQKVRICHMHGKVKRFRGKTSAPKGWKKAYVALLKGQTIDFDGV